MGWVRVGWGGWRVLRVFGAGWVIGIFVTRRASDNAVLSWVHVCMCVCGGVLLVITRVPEFAVVCWVARVVYCTYLSVLYCNAMLYWTTLFYS